YLLTAGTATIVDVALVQVCLQFIATQSPFLLALAIGIGASGGLLVNFALSRRFVFRPDGRRMHEQFATFLAVSLSTALLRIVVAYVLAATLALPLFALVNGLPVTRPVERLAH